jgi:hypothetical protein
MTCEICGNVADKADMCDLHTGCLGNVLSESHAHNSFGDHFCDTIFTRLVQSTSVRASYISVSASSVFINCDIVLHSLLYTSAVLH